jgi:hypothetical protein
MDGDAADAVAVVVDRRFICVAEVVSPADVVAGVDAAVVVVVAGDAGGEEGDVVAVAAGVGDEQLGAGKRSPSARPEKAPDAAPPMSTTVND